VDVRLLAGHCSFGSADASLLEARLIEARRSTAGTSATPGLVRGLADARLATALRAIHERPMHAWTVAELAERVGHHAASTFSAAFSRHVGRSPTHHTRDCAQAHARRDAA
jgi:AraC-like DNA-binding protein